MATVSDEFEVQRLFPTPIGQYDVEFTDQEQDAIDKYCNLDYARHNSYKVDGGKGVNIQFDPYQKPEERAKHPVWDDDFLIMYPGTNILNSEEFQTLKNTVCELGEHYMREVWGANAHPECYLDVSDSWIIRQKATANYETPFHRKHNHAFAWFTGVIYVQDTPNGTVLHPDKDIDHPLLPFAWPLHNTPYNANHFQVEAKKGRIIIFPGSMYHSIVNNQDGQVRYTIPFNLWPYGNISTDNSTMLSYNKVDLFSVER